ncbi:DUF664 domain-containing protein [Aquibacillus halophilus]|uniref:DUF664 domain-containing protein n=1 Tax=Aquibacillus halophilus TaxID=930132 RepID=A0A6A8DN90_9BACI|nr:DinB family protein [Aquibacillus halophilus]MRH44507.1 DUF664 domain-containing protein [Aquibacillus halophilus]
MLKFFEYNWQVRDEWFNWCNQLTAEELVKDRIGGVGSILYTLFHIVDVEHSWIRHIQGKENIDIEFTKYNTLEKVNYLSDTFRIDIADFLQTYMNQTKNELVSVPWGEEFTKDELIHHIIAHEIHHIGQLSVRARELELNPVSADFIRRKFKSVDSY